MKKTKKTLLITTLLLSMIFSAMPAYVAPEKETKVEAATTAIPISNADELYNINNDLGGNYYLTKDIDMKSYGRWVPIEDFYGTLDGKGHAIKNLTTVTDKTDSGLFGSVGGSATIKNLAMVNASITGDYAGGIVGRIKKYWYSSILSKNVGVDGTITIKNCYVSGVITGDSTYRGGILGGYEGFEGVVNISNCYNESTQCRGGIVGSEQYVGSKATLTIENCYNSADCYFGGIVEKLRGTIRNSYSTGNIVNSDHPSYILGGVVEEAYENAYLLNCYYLRDSKAKINLNNKGVGYTNAVSGQSASALNKAAMKKQSSFKDWDFTNTWEMVSGVNEGMPVLRSLRKYFRVSKATADKSANKYYSKAFSVTLKAADGVTIYYTTDGTKPTKNSTAYTAPIKISKNTTLKYITVKSGYKNSSVTTKKYKIRTPKATVSKKGGTYKKKVTVRLTAPKGTTIYYTTNGKNPTKKSKVYKGKLTLKKSTTLKFMTVKEGLSSSVVTTVKYLIK